MKEVGSFLYISINNKVVIITIIINEDFTVISTNLLNEVWSLFNISVYRQMTLVSDMHSLQSCNYALTKKRKSQQQQEQR